MKFTPLLFFLSLGCSEEPKVSSHEEERVEKGAKVDAIVIPPGVKVTIFFGDKADTMGIYGDGRGHHITKDYKTIDKQWTPEDYDKIRALCMELIYSSEVTNERIGGPGFDSMAISFGNARTSADFRYGIVKPEEFPAPVQDLLKAVIELLADGSE